MPDAVDVWLSIMYAIAVSIDVFIVVVRLMVIMLLIMIFMSHMSVVLLLLFGGGDVVVDCVDVECVSDGVDDVVVCDYDDVDVGVVVIMDVLWLVVIVLLMCVVWLTMSMIITCVCRCVMHQYCGMCAWRIMIVSIVDHA